MNTRNLKKFAKYVASTYGNDSSFSNLNEADTEDRLIKPFLTKLGWTFESGEIHSQKYIPLPSADGKKHGFVPDILLSCGESIHIVIESKRISNNSLSLSSEQAKVQFDSTPADIAILTNGLQYWFYSWIYPRKDGAAYMHSTPFAVVDLRHLDLNGRDSFLKYMLRDCFDPIMLKWFNTADHIDRKVYSLLGRRDTRNDKRMGKRVFSYTLKRYNQMGLDGSKLTRKQVKELYRFTQNQSRWNFNNDKYPFELCK